MAEAIGDPIIFYLFIGIAVAGTVAMIITFRPVSTMIPYAYPVARVRARIGRLITPRQLDEITELKNIEDMRNYLRGIPDYSKYVERYPIEKAIDVHLAEVYEFVAKIVPEDVKEVFKALLKRWDIENIKSLLIAKDAGLEVEEIVDMLIPVGELFDELEKLVEVENVEEVVYGLEGTEYSDILEDALTAYKEKGILLPFEAALDNYYLRNIIKAIKSVKTKNREILEHYFGSYVDISNIMLVLRAKVDKLKYEDIEPYLLPAGRQISEWKLRDLMEAENIREVIASLRGFDYEPILSDALPKYEKTKSISVFEEALENYLYKMGRKFLTRESLTVAPILAYLILKEKEIKNLKIIARAKREGIPESRIKKMLIN